MIYIIICYIIWGIIILNEETEIDISVVLLWLIAPIALPLYIVIRCLDLLLYLIKGCVNIIKKIRRR